MAIVSPETPPVQPMQSRCVASRSWDEVFDAPAEPAVRRLFRACLADVAQQAKAVLPQAVNGRLDKACQLVLAGDVQQTGASTWTVASQTAPDGSYTIQAGGRCGCKDVEREELQGWCKHAIARALYVRTTAMVQERMTALDAPAVRAALTAPPAGIPAQFVVEIQGKSFVQFAGLLALAHQQGLVSLTAQFTAVTSELALAHAVATFADGRTFAESGDATPANVNKRIAPHFARMALTRAKARCLRDALNISMVAVEELAD